MFTCNMVGCTHRLVSYENVFVLRVVYVYAHLSIQILTLGVNM